MYEMPYTRKKRYGRTRRKRGTKRTMRYKKRSIKKAFDQPTTLTLRRPGSIMPDRLKTKLVWGDTWQNSNTGNTAHYFISGNSVYDPYVGIGETACQGLDELAAFYSLYRVYASSIRIIVICANASEVINSVVFPTVTQSFNVNPDEDQEQPYARFNITGAASGSSKIKLKNFMTTKRMWGRPTLGADDRFYSATNGNPTNRWYWALGFWNPLSGATTCQPVIQIRCTYYVEFSARKFITNVSQADQTAGPTVAPGTFTGNEPGVTGPFP